MIMKEKAEEKWCPFARVIAGSATICSFNRNASGKPTEHTRCITTSCMMWIEIDYKHNKGKEWGRCSMGRGS